MANYVTITLDTTAPSSPSLSLNGGAQYTTTSLVTATIGTGDGTTTGYQMKLYGDIDVAWAKANGILSSGSPATSVTEAEAQWITFTTSKQLQLTTGDGNKTVNVKIRDDVHNPSAQASDSIIMDTEKPEATVTSPDVSKISKVSGKDTVSFSFTADEAFKEYKVKVVASTGASHDTGVLVPKTAGSTNTSGTGSFPASTPITVTIKGADLETASAGDGAKIVKVFILDTSGNWSV